MAEKQLNVRVQLKYDTYANWTTNNPVLKAGEMAIATIASGNTQEVNSVTPPQVLIKVGDGSSHYNSLPFVSAKAADVYSWAKAENKPTYSASEITGLSDYISGEIQDTDTQYQIVKVSDYSYKLQSKALNGTWADVDGSTIVIPDDTAAIETLQGLVGSTSVATQIANAISNFKTTVVDKKVDSVGAGDASVTIGGTATAPTVAVQLDSTAGNAIKLVSGKGLRVDDHNQTVRVGSVIFTPDADVNIVAGANITVTGKSDNNTITIDGKDWTQDITNAVNAVATAAMEFKGATSVIPMGDLRKGDTYKVSGSFSIPDTGDAEGKGFTAKVGDTIVYDGSKWYLIPSGDDIEDTWRPVAGVNSDASLSFAAGDKLDVSVTATGAITYSHETIAAPTGTAADSRVYINGITTDGYGHITGFTTHEEADQDLSGKADKVKNATSGNFAGLDANGNLTDSGKKAADFATATQGGKADTAVQTFSNNAADYITINAAPITIVNATDKLKNGIAAAETALQEIEAGTGLKVSAKANNKQTIDIDDSVTFVFNCGSSSTLVD